MVKKTRENNTKTVSIYLLFIVIFTVHLYFICNTLDNEFLRYDDIQNYVANPLIKNGIGLKTLIFDIWTDKSIILGVIRALLLVECRNNYILEIEYCEHITVARKVKIIITWIFNHQKYYFF